MKKSLFKWVQISDIHFEPNVESFNTERLRETLKEELKKIKDVNILILTGDYRYAPSGEKDVKPVAKYIKELSACLQLNKTSNDIVLVPGNHDLTRNKKRTAIVTLERKDYSTDEGGFDAKCLASLYEDFSFYSDLAQELNCTYYLADDKNPHALFDFSNCQLLLLNTAITANDNDDAQKLLLGSKYLHMLLHDNKNKPVIALGHHGLELLEEKERHNCSGYLEQMGVHLYLCGHSHELWNLQYNDIRQINVGCLKQKDGSVVVGFLVGELYSDGTVAIDSYKWDINSKTWNRDDANSKQFEKLYKNTTAIEGKEIAEKQNENAFTLKGFTLLGSLGTEGIKYHWEKYGRTVESLAFNKRLKQNNGEENIDCTSAYTISVSYGCQLSTCKQQCKFCETGAKKFQGNIIADDIALQSIFMAEYDSACPSYPQVRNNFREFAYMGQGEPGFNYVSVRQAIKLTDKAMELIGQKVSRHIISTSGVIDFLPALINDIKNKEFLNKVTLHFSLHVVGDDRPILMPIDLEYHYRDFIKECVKLNEISGEKIGVGVLMFKGYKYNKDAKSYTLTRNKLNEILDVLDKDVFKIDLCTLNQTSFGTQTSMSYEEAQSLLDIVIDRGFEGKIFSSFGENLKSGCGMLSSDQTAMQEIGNTTIKHFNNAIELLKKAKANI